MALIPTTSYPGQVDDTDPNMPQGKAQNVSSTGAGDGTPLERAWVNDLWGWQQALLDHVGVTPSGNPDRIGASQYLSAILSIATAAATAVADALANAIETATLLVTGDTEIRGVLTFGGLGKLSLTEVAGLNNADQTIDLGAVSGQIIRAPNFTADRVYTLTNPTPGVTYVVSNSNPETLTVTINGGLSLDIAGNVDGTLPGYLILIGNGSNLFILARFTN